jgi:hypothetical protein
MNMKKHKKELLLILTLLFIACVLFVVNHFLYAAPAKQVQISVNGEVVKNLDLNKDTELLVEGYQGGTNRVVIKGGKVHISEATCPDKICIHQGWIEHTGESIVCVPNHVIVTIIGD